MVVSYRERMRSLGMHEKTSWQILEFSCHILQYVHQVQCSKTKNYQWKGKKKYNNIKLFLLLAWDLGVTTSPPRIPDVLVKAMLCSVSVLWAGCYTRWLTYHATTNGKCQSYMHYNHKNPCRGYNWCPFKFYKSQEHLSQTMSDPIHHFCILNLEYYTMIGTAYFSTYR